MPLPLKRQGIVSLFSTVVFSITLITSKSLAALQPPPVLGDTCDSFAAEWSLTEQTFESLNPDVSWPNPVVGQNYCVVDTVSSALPSSSSSSQSSTRSSSSALPAKTSSTLVTSTRASTTSSSTTSDQPQQTGTGANCNNFYLVQPGDSCPAIESEFGISMSQFIAWNPSVNTGCTNIIAGYYYCVGVPGASKLSTSCNKFYLVQSGDSWNLAVGSSCVTLDVGYYVCVDAINYTPPKTTTATTTTKKTSTTSSDNGIITPTPFETGMVNNFKKFYLVKSGDSCATTATSQEMTATNIEKWNPGVGSLSMTLWLDDYICVSV
ncbi:hypothetical protein THARTR1_03131 [Trichoderma harzianum]|uniref:LysM domain-containing protein n=1 Tax=Trichoderma harzianum TaxID=5544 RepID=A0A2K0UGB3_TRIHA|nr:hypothetical protein THARTR1_03131 [Trichoderma harzianum]